MKCFMMEKSCCPCQTASPDQTAASVALQHAWQSSQMHLCLLSVIKDESHQSSETDAARPW